MPGTVANLRQSIKAQLIERLKRRPLESRLPSVRDLAREFDAAYLTINGVVKELEWEGYVRRIPRKGTFIASRERTVHRDVQTGTSRLRSIIFAYPNYFSYATWVRLHNTEERAIKQRLALVEFKMNPQTSYYAGLRELIEARGDVCGVLVIPVPGAVSRTDVTALDEVGVPVVLLGPSDFASLSQRVWSVTTDWYRCGYLQAQQLLAAGHRRLAFVQHEPLAQERQGLMLRGMRQAVREAGLRQRDLDVLSAGIRPWDDSREAAFELTRELMNAGEATAAIYESIRGVQGAYRAARDLDRRIPDDLSIIATGIGNGDEDYFNPPVTTVDPRPDVEMDVALRCVLRPDESEAKRQTVEPVLTQRFSVSDITAASMVA